MKNLNRLHVGIIAPIQEPIPGGSGKDDTKYGGTERVVSCLVRGLHDQDIQVSLFAAGNSAAEIKELSDFHPLVPSSIREVSPYDKDLPAREIAAFPAALEAIAEAQKMGVDIIHNHIGGSALLVSALGGLSVPMVTTLHGNLGSAVDRAIYGNSLVRKAPLISISNNQRRADPRLNYLATVYNPIPTHIFNPRFDAEPETEHAWPGTIDHRPGEYLAWLGRFTNEKRPHLAIDIAVKLGMPIVLAGKRESSDNEYWNKKIAPRLKRHSDLVSFIGEINDREKNLLLRGAAAFLMPIDWQEPFGLVVGEALACGTPVIATKMGSMPELIEDGKVGFLINPEKDERKLVRMFAEKVKESSTIDRRLCRAHVENKFSIKEHARKTIEAYNYLLAKVHIGLIRVR